MPTTTQPGFACMDLPPIVTVDHAYIPPGVRPHLEAARRMGGRATRRERVMLCAWAAWGSGVEVRDRSVADAAGVPHTEACNHADDLAAEGLWPVPRPVLGPDRVARRAAILRAAAIRDHARHGKPRPSESRRATRERGCGVVMSRRGERGYAGVEG